MPLCCGSFLKIRKGMNVMKENRKLLKEVLQEIRHDMTDEEVLNLLADSKISVNPNKKKINTLSDSVLRTP